MFDYRIDLDKEELNSKKLQTFLNAKDGFWQIYYTR